MASQGNKSGELAHYIVTQSSGNKLMVSSEDGLGPIVIMFPFSSIRKASNKEADSYIRKLEDQERLAKKMKKAKR